MCLFECYGQFSSILCTLSRSSTDVITALWWFRLSQPSKMWKFSPDFVKTAFSCAELLFSNIKQHIKQQKITFEELLDLTNMLQTSSYSHTLMTIRERLVKFWYINGKNLLEAMIVSVKIADYLRSELSSTSCPKHMKKSISSQVTTIKFKHFKFSSPKHVGNNDKQRECLSTASASSVEAQC